MEEMGKTLHRIAWELRPPSIDELGLRKAVASYTAEWSERCGTEVDFHCDDPRLDDIPSDIGTAIYRVVQEGLTNIVKHAGRPTSVSVIIRRVDAVLHVIIEMAAASMSAPYRQRAAIAASVPTVCANGLCSSAARLISNPRAAPARRFSPASLSKAKGRQRDKDPDRAC